MENNQLELAKKLNSNVLSVISKDNIQGFEKAFLIANAAMELKSLLTPEYMKPILELQGNKLGFKTDKDGKGGYDIDTVKNCLIEAVLTGVQPFGNQFNIIAGNCYITKEGFGYLLANFKGLRYSIIPELPRVNPNNTSAAIKMNIEWTINGQENSKSIEIPVKMNAYMGTDAVIGKATRKARAWLFNTLTGCEISDGDIADYDGKVTISIDQQNQAEENKRIISFIEKAKNLEELSNIEETVEMTDEVRIVFDKRKEELK